MRPRRTNPSSMVPWPYGMRVYSTPSVQIFLQAVSALEIFLIRFFLPTEQPKSRTVPTRFELRSKAGQREKHRNLGTVPLILAFPSARSSIAVGTGSACTQMKLCPSTRAH